MRRRDVIALIAGTAAGCLAIRVRAQQSKFQLDILENTRNTDVDELLKGLRDHAYVEGQNLIIEFPTPPEAPSTSTVSAASNRARSRSANQAVS
jgi:hypothetical protein